MKKSRTKVRHKTTLTGRIACPPMEVDGLAVSCQQAFAIEMGRFGPKEMKKALADSETFTSLLREYPKEMAAIVNDTLAGRTDNARESALKIGLTEDVFQEKGGGLLFWIGIGFCAGVIFVAAATRK